VRDTEKEIQQLTNEVFTLHNKLENLHSMQTSSQHRLEELSMQMQQTHSSVEGVRNQLADYNEKLQVNAAKLAEADEAFRVTEANYGEATRQHTMSFNLNVTKQHSKINALKNRNWNSRANSCRTCANKWKAMVSNSPIPGPI